jgi:hypothetical protein
MPFLVRNVRVVSNSSQSIVKSGLYGTVLAVHRRNGQSEQYEIKWDSYNCGLCFDRRHFELVKGNDSKEKALKKAREMREIITMKHKLQRKMCYNMFWKSLDDEQIWEHFYAVQARNIVPVCQMTETAQKTVEMFDSYKNDCCTYLNTVPDKLPAKGSIVRSVQNSTVKAGLLGEVTNTKCTRGGFVTFYILWEGYFVSINYALHEFVIVHFAEFDETRHDDPNKSLAILATTMSVNTKRPFVKRKYQEQDARVVFDNSWGPSHIVVCVDDDDF